ncbi:hypothetical protein MUP46_03530 [Patescibacteria group bacterium]|nr:hypothetical protein [Patescibacteria group bacterium]
MKQQLKNIGQQFARQVVQEPTEILKEAGEQVAGVPSTENKPQQPQVEKPVTPQEVQRKHAKARSLYTALENELKEIRVRKAQDTQAEQQVQNPPVQEKPLVEPQTKHSRRLFGFGQKAQAEKQKTHVERPVQSST